MMWLLERIAWKIAHWTYHPQWCLGNRRQRKWYGWNGRLLSWLNGQLLRSLKEAETMLKEAEAEQNES